TETTRAVALAMPLLHQAKQVFVLEVAGSSVSGPSAQDVSQALRREGIDVQARSVTESNFSSAEIFLSEANALTCDLIIKGAYTQRRLRQMFFGGAKSYILHHAELPIFMAH